MGKTDRMDRGPRHSFRHGQGSCASERSNGTRTGERVWAHHRTVRATYRTVLVASALGLESVGPADQHAVVAQLGENFDVVLAGIVRFALVLAHSNVILAAGPFEALFAEMRR